MTAALAAGVDEMVDQLRVARFGRRDYLGLNNGAVTRIGDIVRQARPAEVLIADIRTVLAAFELIDHEMYVENEEENQ